MNRYTVIANCLLLCLFLSVSTSCKKEEVKPVDQTVDSLYTEPDHRDTYVGSYEGIATLTLTKPVGVTVTLSVDSNAIATVTRDNTTQNGMILNAPDGQEWKVPNQSDLSYIGDWSIGANQYRVVIQYYYFSWQSSLNAFIYWTQEYPEGGSLSFSYNGIKIR